MNPRGDILARLATMSLWQRILRALGYKKASDRLSFPMDMEAIRSLQELADQQQRSRSEIAAELLADALLRKDAAAASLQQWRSLTEREQQVTALICLGCTNLEIAEVLTIAPDTVKSHVRNVLTKFGLRSKAELRQSLAEWDFSAWRE
jgi:DNA-binding CsgD family transcriptional regulator